MQLIRLLKFHFLRKNIAIGKDLSCQKSPQTKGRNYMRMLTPSQRLELLHSQRQKMSGYYSERGRLCQGHQLLFGHKLRSVSAYWDGHPYSGLLHKYGSLSRKTAFLKAHQSLVNSVTFSLRKGTAHSTGLMQAQCYRNMQLRIQTGRRSGAELSKKIQTKQVALRLAHKHAEM